MRVLHVAFERYAVPVGGIGQKAVDWLVGGEDDELAKVRVGGNDLFTPIAKDITRKRRFL